MRVRNQPTKTVTAYGVTATLKEWAAALEVSVVMLTNRHAAGWFDDLIVTEGSVKGRKGFGTKPRGSSKARNP